MLKTIILITSLLFGIFGFISVSMLILAFVFPNEISQLNLFSIYAYLGGVFFYLGWVFDLIGLISGIIVFKSEFKRTAKLSIILSVLGLLGYPLLFVLMWRMFGGI
jgi:uncharacterized protein YacL